MAAYAALVSVMHIIDDIQRHHSPPISLDQRQLQSLTQVVTSLQEFLEAYNSPFADGDGADPLEIRIEDAAYAAEDVIESHIVDEIHLQNQQTTSLADGHEAHPLEMRIADATEDVIESHVVDNIHLQNQQTGSLADGDEPDILEMLIRAVAAEDVIESHVVDNIHLQNQQTASLADGDEPDNLEMLIREMLIRAAIENVIESHIMDEIHLQNQQTSSLADSDEPDLLEMLRPVAAEDVIESHIVDKIHLQNQQTTSLASKMISCFFNCFRAPKDFYQSPVADGDEADPLEMRIADAAYAVEDVIESHILDNIQQPSFLESKTSFPAPKDVYQSPVADGDEADPSEMRIADAAYAVEDVIESHIMDTIQQPSSLESKTSFPAPKNLYQDLQQVIDKMESINEDAMKIVTEKAGVVHNHGVSASAAPLRSSSSSSAMVCPEAVLLGLMEKLTGGQLERQVIPIVGMGGIGKTTLARNIYAHQLIKYYFDVCGWVTISQQYNIRELLCEVLSQLATNRKNEELSQKSEDELGSELYKYLFGRRFLIVMDDMWRIDSWEKIQHFFPNNGNGSRILVTTRQSQLCSQLNTNYSLQMEFLDEVRSWNLFTKTVFGERSCPPELVEIGKKIVSNCRGLPLSIVVVGGILKKMEHTQGCWESIRNNLASLVNLENDKHCLRLLKLSYNHLPVYLKPCFLYMGVFEEDDQIRVSMIIKLWVSEGFLKPMNGRSSETIAMGFLKDLVNRNLIMIDELGCTGNIKWCKIHDLLRDLCLNEVQKDGFYHVIGRSEGIDRQCRRIVIPGKTSKEKVLEGLPSMSRPRSIICENGEVPPCPNLGLLRTFHAYKRSRYGDQSYMNSLEFQSVNLRHLAIAVDRMSSFFSSVDLFWSLHTLIVSCSNYKDGVPAPVEIWTMRQLRHIEFRNCPLCLVDPPSNMDEDGVAMENLQVLKGVMNLKCSEKVVKRIPNIKKLEVRYGGQLKDSMSDDYYCVGNIKYLSKLESLSVDFDEEHSPYMHKLSFPQSLKKLTLSISIFIKFEWEEMLEKIGSLPCLEKLVLWWGCFGTRKWEIVEGQFPELKYLGLESCGGLKQWTVEGSSVLRRLEQLRLFNLEELEEIPCEIGYIPTLQKITMDECSESAVRSAKELVEEQVECQGEPLPFHVQVFLRDLDDALLSLAARPSFTIDYVR